MDSSLSCRFENKSVALPAKQGACKVPGAPLCGPTPVKGRPLRLTRKALSPYYRKIAQTCRGRKFSTRCPAVQCCGGASAHAAGPGGAVIRRAFRVGWGRQTSGPIHSHRQGERFSIPSSTRFLPEARALMRRQTRPSPRSAPSLPHSPAPAGTHKPWPRGTWWRKTAQ